MNGRCDCCGCKFTELVDNRTQDNGLPPTEVTQQRASVTGIAPSSISFYVAGSASVFNESASLNREPPTGPVVSSGSSVRPIGSWPFYGGGWVPADGTQYAIDGIASEIIDGVVRMGDEQRRYPILPLAGAFVQRDIRMAAHRWLPDREENAGLLTVRSGSLPVDDFTPVNEIGPLYNRKQLNSPMRSAGQFNQAVSVRGKSIAIYRDGEEVFSGDRENAGQTDYIPETGVPGSYLVISNGGTNFFTVGQQLAAFTISTTLPVFGFGAIDDAFSGEVVRGHRLYRMATKPYKAEYEDVFNDDYTVSPERVVTALPSSIGTHTLTIDQTNRQDAYGNVAEFVQRPSYRVWAVPANNRRGARPALSDPGFSTVPYFSPRPQSQRVETVTLTFDRKVRRDTVTASQFKLSVNGQPSAPVEIEEIGESGTRWLVRIPTDVQLPRKVCALEYNPAGTLTDDIVTLYLDSESDFPPAANASYKTVYVSTATQKRYSKSPSGYVEVQGPPLDANGIPFDPEPCLLVARISWLMNGQELFPKLIDVRSVSSFIGGTASISKEITVGAWPSSFWATSVADRTFFAAPQSLSYYTDHEPPSFTPRVPQASDYEADCSYFGIPTTIHPCPPKTIGLCAVPRSPEIHSSAIRSEAEIIGFVVTPPEEPTFEDDPAPGDESRVTSDAITAAFSGEMTFVDEEDGNRLSQNLWACQQPGISRSGKFFRADGTPLAAVPFLVEQEAVDVHAILNAWRVLRCYPALETAYMGPLNLSMRVIVGVEETVSHAGLPPESGPPPVPGIPAKEWFNTYPLLVQRTFVFTEAQEESLAAGEEVVIDGWKIQATINS